MGGGAGGRGSSRSSFGSSLSGSPAGSESSFRGKDPMQYSDDEDEGNEGYKVGGYHTVKVLQASVKYCQESCSGVGCRICIVATLHGRLAAVLVLPSRLRLTLNPPNSPPLRLALASLYLQRVICSWEMSSQIATLW